MYDWEIRWAPEISDGKRATLNWLFMMAVLAEGAWAIIQAEKVYRTKSASDLSQAAVITILAANVIIIMAAVFLLRSYQLLLGALIYLSALIVLLVGIEKYK